MVVVTADHPENVCDLRERVLMQGRGETSSGM